MEDFLPFLKMGVTVASFHDCGRVPVERILLSTDVSRSSSASATSFKTCGWWPSRPGDLLILRDFNFRRTSSFVNDISDSDSWEMSVLKCCQLVCFIDFRSWTHCGRRSCSVFLLYLHLTLLTCFHPQDQLYHFQFLIYSCICIESIELLFALLAIDFSNSRTAFLQHDLS